LSNYRFVLELLGWKFPIPPNSSNDVQGTVGA
jgi:hypothetical protein